MRVMSLLVLSFRKFSDGPRTLRIRRTLTLSFALFSLNGALKASTVLFLGALLIKHTALLILFRTGRQVLTVVAPLRVVFVNLLTRALRFE